MKICCGGIKRALALLAAILVFGFLTMQTTLADQGDASQAEDAEATETETEEQSGGRLVKTDVIALGKQRLANTKTKRPDYENVGLLAVRDYMEGLMMRASTLMEDARTPAAMVTDPDTLAEKMPNAGRSIVPLRRR